MNWSSLWPWRWGHARMAPVRRTPCIARLAIEALEDRLVPSAATSDDAAYTLWRAQQYTIGDAVLSSDLIQRNDPIQVVTTSGAGVQATPANASFGSLIGLPTVFTSTSYRGTGYSVAVIDTGIDYTHLDLGGGFGAGHRVIAGWDFVNNDANPLDDNGHGTHVAGIIGSSSATYSGVAPNVNFIALKVLNANGSGSFGAVEDALKWVTANQARYNIVAVNLSLGAGNYTTNPYTFLDDEFTAIRNAGGFISVAAGNSYYAYGSQPGLDFPAVDPLVVSVGAVYAGNFGSVAWASGARDFTTAADRIASFSQRGAGLSLMAPGAILTSTYLGNTYKAMAGTSMAAPVVAGAAALLHQAMDTRQLAANQDSILALMKSTGVNVFDGDDENDNVTNTGLTFKRLDLGAALGTMAAPVNRAPVLQPISDQFVVPGGTTRVTLGATDPDGNAITYTARVLSSSGPALALQLDQQYGLTYPGSYYTNIWGHGEKWMTGAGGKWFCILPNGELRRWTGAMSTTLQSANLLATLETRYFTDPSLLWNAQAVSVTPSVSVSGNQLTISTPAGATGSYQIEVTASDGSLTATRTFAVSVVNTAPVIAAIANQSMLTNRSQTITLNATDAQNDPITYSVSILGSFSTRPATLVLNGKQLTIHSAPDFIGSFDVQVTASDGSRSSATTFRVTVSGSQVAQRFSADFNGDGIKDTAFFNQDGSWWVSLAKADGTFTNQQWAQWSAASNWSTVQIGDFNGDKKADIVGFGVRGAVSVGLSTASSFNAKVWAQWSAAVSWTSIKFADFNGDGKTDLFGFGTNGSIWVGLSTGSSFKSKLWAQWSTPSNWTTISLADVNGDGKLDLVGLNKTGKYYVGYSTGASFNTQIWKSATPPASVGSLGSSKANFANVGFYSFDLLTVWSNPFAHARSR